MSLQSRDAKEVIAIGAPTYQNTAALSEGLGYWLSSEDEYSDVVISSRIRLARNLKGHPFPNKATSGGLLEILDKVKAACEDSSALQDSVRHEIQSLSELERKFLVERRLASPQLIESGLPSMVVTDRSERLSIMVNEEDHLRLQCLEGGLRIPDAWREISTLDDELEGRLAFGYSPKFGYLTACPTNIGTGLRVSVFAHLPGLTLKNDIHRFIDQLPTSEIAIRGFYGEGTDSMGDIFQISNQLTLGRTEKNVIQRMTAIAKEIAGMERAAREDLLANQRLKLEDTVFRAVGILSNARIMSSLEAMKLISALRLGCELGLVPKVSRLKLNQLMVLIQPAHLQKVWGKKLAPEERAIARVSFIKHILEF